MSDVPSKVVNQSPDDENCFTIVNDVASQQLGIVNVQVDTKHEVVSFDFDPQITSEREVERIAKQVEPILRRRFDTCTIRLGKQGGRACEACAIALEQQAQQIPGVRRATASYMGGVLKVTYDQSLVSPAAIAHRVKNFGVAVEAAETVVTPGITTPTAQPTSWTQARVWLTSERLEAIFTLITFVTMGGGWLAENFLPTQPLWHQALYLIAYVTGGAFGLKGGIEALRHWTIDIDLLMVLAAIGAAIVGAPFEGAMLLFLFSLSNTLQNFAMERTRNAIKALMKLRPAQAWVKRGSHIVSVPIEKVLVGDLILVRPGDRVPLDGVIVEGESALDQSSMTGESLPVNKSVGDGVLAGTVNKNGSLDVRVTKLAKDSTLAKLIKLVEEAHSEKAHTQRFIDKAEQYYALGVILLTIGAIIAPVVVFSEAFASAFYRAMTLMVGASPCALVISTPAAILSAIGNGARRGILFKGGAYVEAAAGIKVVTFDKTGTLTMGKPHVTNVIPLAANHGHALSRADATKVATTPLNENDLLALAASVEAKSEHPLARAIVEAAHTRKLTWSEALAFQAAVGKGARASVHGREVRVGNLRYFEGLTCEGLAEAQTHIARMEGDGKTCMIVAAMLPDGQTAQCLGVLACADVVRPDAAKVVRDLKLLGVERVVMLTGDNQRAAQAIAKQTGVDEVYAELLPEDKLRLMKELGQQFGPVAMVGDGVNDAPALAAATIGIAMGAAGTDVALETADVVLMSDDLRNIPYVIALSRQTRKTLLLNLGFAMFMIGLLIVGALFVALPLPLAVVGHEGGTVIVSLNGLRLLLYRR
jgi:Cd2+/Zn2+-exporting ATPase